MLSANVFCRFEKRPGNLCDRGAASGSDGETSNIGGSGSEAKSTSEAKMSAYSGSLEGVAKSSSSNGEFAGIFFFRLGGCLFITLSSAVRLTPAIYGDHRRFRARGSGPSLWEQQQPCQGPSVRAICLPRWGRDPDRTRSDAIAADARHEGICQDSIRAARFSDSGSAGRLGAMSARRIHRRLRCFREGATE